MLCFDRTIAPRGGVHAQEIGVVLGEARKMSSHFLRHWLAPLEETAHSQQDNFASRESRLRFGMVFFLIVPALAAAQTVPGAPVGSETQKCAALAELNLETAPRGPAFITSAHLVEVSASGLEQWILIPSGFASSSAHAANRIHQYCDVTGYVAPQNKFELKLPLLVDWNEKFFLSGCGGFCGKVFSEAGNHGLARGYASVTGNGGHESSGIGFEGFWPRTCRRILPGAAITLSRSLLRPSRRNTTENRSSTPTWKGVRKVDKPFW